MSAQRKHKNPFLVGSDFDMNSIRASHTTTTATSSATAHSSSSSFGNNVGDTATRLTEETLAVQSESAARMANAARIAQETQVTATKNLQQIHSQGEQLRRIDGTLDFNDSRVDHAEKQTKYLSKLAKLPFFIPVFGKNPDGQKKRKNSDVSSSPAAEPLTATSAATSSSSSRFGGFLKFKNKSSSKEPLSSSTTSPTTASYSSSSLLAPGATLEQMSTSNAFEAEIDRGLESVSDAVRNIKLMSLEMGGELETHSSLIRSIDDKVSVQTEKIGRINKKLNKIK